MATPSVRQSSGFHSQTVATIMPQPSVFTPEDNRAAAHRLATDRLSSWKEIAVYLRQGVRTVQRYERHYQLPVHRMNDTSRSPVFALKSEIDSWLRTRVNHRNPVQAARAGRSISANLVSTSAELVSVCGVLQRRLRSQLEELKQHLERLQAVRFTCPRSQAHPLAGLTAEEIVRRNS